MVGAHNQTYSSRPIQGVHAETSCPSPWFRKPRDTCPGLSDSGDCCREGGPRVEAIFDVGDARLRFSGRERKCCGMIACLYEE